MLIEKKLISKNHTKGRSGSSIEYIVIHDTGNPSPKSNADAHFRYFDSGDRNSSAHYFVDDTKVLQVVEDEDVAWHCGKLYSDTVNNPDCKNKNSIGVEMCVNSDGDYEQAFQNTVELTQRLMKKYGIDETKVIRHYDACKKHCPASFSQSSWQRWGDFKKRLKSDFHVKKEKEELKPTLKQQKVEYKGTVYTVPSVEVEGYNYLQIREIAKILQLKIDYEESSKTIQIR